MSRLQRKSAVTIEEALKAFLKEARLSSGLNTQRIFAAWDEASGAGKYTIGKYCRDGKLYITLNSSVVRNQLYFQKKVILDQLNSILEKDSLFIKDDSLVSYVKEIILK